MRSSPTCSPRWTVRWAVFKRSGTWTRQHIHTPWDFSSPQPQGNIDPQGCLFDAKARLFVNDVGHGAARDPDGSLIVFFPGRDKRYSTYCFIDKGLFAPGMPVMDDAGNVYVPEPAAGKITKFSPPFPARPLIATTRIISSQRRPRRRCSSPCLAATRVG